MSQNKIFRIIIITLVLVVACFYLAPSFVKIADEDSTLGKILPNKKVNFGLDLVGGIYVTMGVDVDGAIDNSLVRISNNLRDVARDKGINITQPREVGGSKVEFMLPDASKSAELQKLLSEQTSGISFEEIANADGVLRCRLSYTAEARAKLADDIMDASTFAMRSRIDKFGMTEPDIRRQTNESRIIVQLPGIKDTEQALQHIGQTAKLEFYVERSAIGLDQNKLRVGILPPGTKIFFEGDGTGSSGILVESLPPLTGEYLVDASQGFDEKGKPSVDIVFDKYGGNIFEKVTEEHSKAKKRLVIVLDGKVISAPVLNYKISGGRAAITGSFSIESAQGLANLLKSGALPADVSVLEERTVGPSLGQESIDKGVKAALVGCLAVVLFMVVYYSFSGVIASIMIALDVLLILAGMAAFGATLTLPGIAGIVLTIGMAVDANVLIFERIREELNNGLSPYSAMDHGFSRATITILDSNLTTVIAAIVLYQFGTGPVRGFAVTLTLGIIVSMFTAIFVSRTVFDLWLNKNSAKISI